MTRFDTILQDLQEKVARKQKLSTMLDELKPVQRRLETRVRELDAIRIKEQSDVDKLEGGSLAAFFYNVIGKMDQQLDKEREEAYAAAVRYDTALRELEAVEDDIRRYQEELRDLSGVEGRLSHCAEGEKRSHQSHRFGCGTGDRPAGGAASRL